MIDVSRTFQANEILITGANGFVGKVALAMLLARYPDAARVHVLVRPRRGVAAQKRFEDEVLASPVFQPFDREAFAKRIVVHEGDAAELGEAAAQAMANVRLIIQCAGLVAFGIFAELPPMTGVLIAAGGVLYTVGIGFYLARRVPFHMTIWHGFVLVASVTMYAAAVVAVLA